MTAIRRSVSLARATRLRAKSSKKARQDRAKGPIRLQVFDRDGWRCRFAVLGHSPCAGHFPTYHHIVKESQGGGYTVENGATACAFHNDLVESDAYFALMSRTIGLVKSPDRTFSRDRRVRR